MDNDANTAATTANITPTEEARTTTDPAGNQGGTVTPAEEKTKGENLFTQEDASAFAAREAKKAREGLLRQLGINGDDVKSVAEKIKQYDEWQEAQKTEAERIADNAKVAQEALDTERNKTVLLERKVVALGKGVPAEKLNDYVSLATARMSDDVDFESALDKALEAFPVQKEAEKGPTIVAVAPANKDAPPLPKTLRDALTEKYTS